MNLFLDDMRKPAAVRWVEDFPQLVNWQVVRTYQEFVDKVLAEGVPRRASFDHDLAEEHYQEYLRTLKSNDFRYEAMQEKTGRDALKWLLEHCAEKNLPRPQVWFHTMNGEGKRNMESLVKSFDKVHPHLIPSES